MSSNKRDLWYYLEPVVIRLIESLSVEERQRLFDKLYSSISEDEVQPKN